MFEIKELDYKDELIIDDLFYTEIKICSSPLSYILLM